MPNAISTCFITAILGIGSLAFSASLDPAHAEPDVIRVQAENDAYFDIGRIKLTNLESDKSDTNGDNYRGRDGKTKSVKMEVPATGEHEQSYRFEIDPVGTVGGRSGLVTCLEFDVTSKDGQISGVNITGPNGALGASGESWRRWDSVKSNPQRVTIYTKIVGDLTNGRCDVKRSSRKSR